MYVTVGNPSAAGVVEDVRDGRESFRHLPDQVRRPDQERQPGRDPRVSRPQLVAQRLPQKHCDDQPGDQAEDRVFDLETDPERDAEQNPVARPSVEDEADKPVERKHPRDLVEGHGLKHPVDAEQVGGCHGRQQRDRLQLQGAAKTAHVKRRNDDENAAEQAGENPKSPRSRTQQARLEPRQKGHDRREVDVAERRMEAAVEVVELVGVEAEGGVGREVKSNDHRGGASEEASRAGRRTRVAGQHRRHAIRSRSRRPSE